MASDVASDFPDVGSIPLASYKANTFFNNKSKKKKIRK